MPLTAEQISQITLAVIGDGTKIGRHVGNGTYVKVGECLSPYAELFAASAMMFSALKRETEALKALLDTIEGEVSESLIAAITENITNIENICDYAEFGGQTILDRQERGKALKHGK